MLLSNMAVTRTTKNKDISKEMKI